MNNGQLTLLAFGDMDMQTQTVFRANEKKNEKGDIVTQSISLGKRSDVAKALGLQPKVDAEKLDEKVLAARDDLKGKIAQLLVKISNSDDWTGTGLRVNKAKSGLLSVNIRCSQVKRASGPSVEAIASKLGLPVEEVQNMIERQKSALKAQQLEAETVSEPPVEEVAAG
jgi:hypothetical protein